MHYGAQYYPEHWPEERWKTDAEMMRRAGFNVVRMGEFAWGAYEPREGELDFSWMDRAIALLGEHGIRTILCTCSRTPPPWAYHDHPGILNVQPDGTPHHTDGRYRIGHAHPEFVELSRRIDGDVIRHFAGNENVVAWQVDNEVGSQNDCYCSMCRAAFQRYLEEKYGTPEALSQAWGAKFWSFAFTEFAQVPTPGGQPQLEIEYRRWISRVNVEFTKWRADLIHELDPGKKVTTNFQNIRASHTDVHDAARVIDVSGLNHYPSRTPELALDWYRGPRDEVWALEQHSRLQSTDTKLGRTRLWAWMATARGATGVVFFRWRQCRWGQEQYADGLLPHGGQENRFYEDVARMGAELKQMGELVDATKPRAEAAIVLSYESRWAVKAGRFPRELDPVEAAMRYHRSLARRTGAIDAMDPREDLSRHKLVIAPRLWVVDDAVAANLRTYVEGGGTLCLTAGSGVADACGKSFDVPRPGPLREIAGIEVSDIAHEGGMRLPVTSTVIGLPEGSCGALASDEIHVTGADVVATYAGGWRDGAPAMTSNAAGKGRVVYVGTLLEDGPRDAVVAWLCGLVGLASPVEVPPDVSVYERRSDDARVMWLINWADEVRAVSLNGTWRDPFTGEICETAQIAPGDLRILTAPVR